MWGFMGIGRFSWGLDSANVRTLPAKVDQQRESQRLVHLNDAVDDWSREVVVLV